MKVLSWSFSIVLAVVVAGLAFIHFSPDYNMYLVRSESMKPAINMGDLVITGPLGGPLNGEIKPGTIVTYERGKEMVTHRVVSLVDINTLVTKGDAAEDPDPNPVTISQIRGAYLFKLPYLGYLSSFIRTKVGWFVIIILPAMLLVALIIKEIVREALKEYRNNNCKVSQLEGLNNVDEM
jgi:signal peptidase